jgi:hypothetical protein
MLEKLEPPRMKRRVDVGRDRRRREETLNEAVGDGEGGRTGRAGEYQLAIRRRGTSIDSKGRFKAYTSICV